MKLAIAQILFDEGYITKYDVIDDGNFDGRKSCNVCKPVWRTWVYAAV
mgnify:CR=1 FL=1